MHGIIRIDRAGMRQIHFHRVGRFKPALARSQVLLHEMKVLHLQSTYRNGHPAILIAMIMHRTSLSNFPADGEQFVQRSLIDKIARVMLPVPGQVARERLRVDRSILPVLRRFCIQAGDLVIENAGDGKGN